MAGPAAVILSAALVAAGAAARVESAGSALRVDFDDKAWKEAPVAKVVNLLKDMQATLEKEADQDQELYDKLACWCETNSKEKTKAIETANQQIADLTATIDESTAKHKSLTTELASLKEEIEDNTKALDTSTTLREKENAQWNQDEKDAISAIGNLKGAVTTLSKHNEGSSLLEREALTQVTGMLRQRLKTHPSLIQETVAPHQRKFVMDLLGKKDSFLQQPAGFQSYAPGGGEIFGILKQMKESFETNMEQGKKDEASAAASFSSLKAAKEEEINAASEKVFEKTKEDGETVAKNAEAKEDLAKTQESLASDTAFLADLKQKCAVTDEDWEARSKMRQEEIAAVSETIEMLQGDDARDLFGKTMALVQLREESKLQAAQRAKAVRFLEQAADRLNSPRIAYLAERSRFDPFGSLRSSIDGMTGALDKEKTDEIHHKDDCVSDFNENEKQTTERNGHKDDVEQEISDLDADISRLNDEEKRLAQEIADAKVELKKASENRESENKEFQETIADQRATQTILKKAKDRLAEFYSKKAALVQAGKQAPMPEGFKPYKKDGNSGGAMLLIENIIADSVGVEKDAITAEQKAQEAYESFVKMTNEAIKTKYSSITSDEETESKEKINEANDETDKRGTINDLLNLGSMNGALHTSCDFTLDNFETRQTARDSEVEALKQAKAIFSGMK